MAMFSRTLVCSAELLFGEKAVEATSQQEAMLVDLERGLMRKANDRAVGVSCEAQYS